MGPRNAFIRLGRRVKEIAAGEESSQPTNNRRNVRWIDGLRGLASISVIGSHLARAFDYDLFKASDSPEATPRFFQLPILRLMTQGRIGVAIFALMTGFVCGIKPIKQIRSSDPHAAARTIGLAIFKRPMRLMFPCAISTFLAWLMCELGGFYMASRCDSLWLRLTTAQPKGNFGYELWRLQDNLRSVWTDGENEFDDFQWTLLPLLKASLYVYFALAATAFCKTKWRMAAVGLLFAYFWQDTTPESETFYCMAFFGLFLSELSQSSRFQTFLSQPSYLRRLSALILIFAGLWIGSYPKELPDWQPWTRTISPLRHLFPTQRHPKHELEDPYLPKRFTAVGLIVMVSGIVLSNTTKKILSSPPFLWLGRFSFAVYLTHGMLLKSVLLWMLYGVSGEPFDTEEKLDPFGRPRGVHKPGVGWFWVCVPLWIGVVYAVAWVWTTYVDTACERASMWIMGMAFEEEEKTVQQGSLA